MPGATMANNFDGTGSSNRLNIPGRNSQLPLTNPSINRQLQYLPPPPPGMNQFGQFTGENQENTVPRNGSPGYNPGFLSSGGSADSGGPGRSPSPVKDPNDPFPGTTKTTLRRNSNFAGPTFSELMRRSAPVYKDFSSSLRDNKAFFVATPTVITNANQDPQFAVVRRASVAMHAAKLEAAQAVLGMQQAAFGPGASPESHGQGQGQSPIPGDAHPAGYGSQFSSNGSNPNPGPAGSAPVGGEHQHQHQHQHQVPEHHRVPAPRGSTAAADADIANNAVQHQPFAW